MLAMTACGAKTEAPADVPADAPAGDIEIAVVLKTLASEYWGYVKEGCDQAAAELGIKVTVVGPGAESDIEGQVSMIEQQIGAGVDAIVCAPNDAGAAGNALKAALEELLGVDLPDEQIEQLIDGIKAKLALDNLGDALGALGGLFGKKKD